MTLPNDIAEQFLRVGEGAVPVSVNGVATTGLLRRPFRNALNVEGYKPFVICATESLPAIINHEDALTADGEEFLVINVQPFSRKVTKILLEEKPTSEPQEPETFIISLSGEAYLGFGFLDEAYPNEPLTVQQWEDLHRESREVRLTNGESVDCHPIIKIEQIAEPGGPIPATATIDWVEMWVYGYLPGGQKFTPAWTAYKCVTVDLSHYSWLQYGNGREWDQPGGLSAGVDYEVTPILGSGIGFGSDEWTKLLYNSDFLAEVIANKSGSSWSMILHDSGGDGTARFLRTGELQPYLRIQYTTNP